MEIIINRSLLAAELSAVLNAVEKKNTIPVLSHILLEVEDDKMTICGTDLDVTLTTSIGVQTDESGAVLLPSKKIYDFLSVSKDDYVTISVEDKAATVKCGKSKIRIATLSSDDFPVVTKEAETPYKVDAGKFKLLTQRGGFAHTLEDSRYALNSVRVLFNQNRLTFTSTSGGELTVASVDHSYNEASPLSCMVQPRVLTMATRIAEGEIGVGVDDNCFSIRCGRRLIASRTVAGTYPNVEMLYPIKSTRKAVLKSADVCQAIDAVKITADIGHAGAFAVSGEFTPDSILLKTDSSNEGQSEAAVSSTNEGEPFGFAFNGNWLGKALKAYGHDQVKVEWDSPTRMLQVTPITKDDVDFIYVLALHSEKKR